MYYKNDVKKILSTGIKNVKPFLIDEWKNISQYLYFTGIYKKKIKIFIKSRGISDSVFREYKISKDLKAKNKKYFPKPFFYKLDNSIKFIAIEYVYGERLDNIIKSNKFNSLNKNFRKNLYQGLFEILKILHNSKIVHRDIRPANLIIKKNGTPVLIDFQFAVDIKRKIYKEFKEIKKKPKLIATLGREYLRGRFYWDDAYSFAKILDNLKSNDRKYFEIKLKIKKLIGKNVIISVKNNFFSKFLVLLKFYFSKIKNKII